jgi:hypothetical protein
VEIIREVKKCADFLMDDIQNALNTGNSASSVNVPEPKLFILYRALSHVFRGSRDMNACIQDSTDFSVFIQEKKPKFGEERKANGRLQRVLSYWCFSSGVAMEAVAKLGVRSIILTSGK